MFRNLFPPEPTSPSKELEVHREVLTAKIETLMKQSPLSDAQLSDLEGFERRLRMFERLKDDAKKKSSQGYTRRVAASFLAIFGVLFLLGLQGPKGAISTVSESRFIELTFFEGLDLDHRNLIFGNFAVREIFDVTKIDGHFMDAIEGQSHNLEMGKAGGSIASIAFEPNSTLMMRLLGSDKISIELEGVAQISVSTDEVNVCQTTAGSNCQKNTHSDTFTLVPGSDFRVLMECSNAEGCNDPKAPLDLLSAELNSLNIKFGRTITNPDETSREYSFLEAASIQFSSFGGETALVSRGQELVLSEAKGYLETRVLGGSLVTSFEGTGAAGKMRDAKYYHPSMLAWLWGNPAISFVYGVFIALLGLVLRILPKRVG